MTSENGSIPGALGKEVRNRLIVAAATGIVGGIIAAIVSVWTFVGSILGTVGVVPKGAVMAFALERGCPTGWEDYKEGWGRFIVGAVDQNKIGQIPVDFAQDARGEKLLPKDFGRPGGEEKHILTIGEMPTHAHSITLNRKWGDKSNQETGWGSDDGNHPASTVTTSAEGNSQPHNILPPYVALYMCRKT